MLRSSRAPSRLALGHCTGTRTWVMCLLLWACNFHRPLGPLEAEAKAVDVAISSAKDIGLQEVTLESDYSVLIGALSDTSKVSISIENIITGIHNNLQHFRQHQMLHVKWQGNTPTHRLARHVKGLNNFIIWIEQTPFFIESAVI